MCYRSPPTIGPNAFALRLPQVGAACSAGNALSYAFPQSIPNICRPGRLLDWLTTYGRNWILLATPQEGHTHSLLSRYYSAYPHAADSYGTTGHSPAHLSHQRRETRVPTCPLMNIPIHVGIVEELLLSKACTSQYNTSSACIPMVRFRHREKELLHSISLVEKGHNLAAIPWIMTARLVSPFLDLRAGARKIRQIGTGGAQHRHAVVLKLPLSSYADPGKQVSAIYWSDPQLSLFKPQSGCLTF